MLFVYPRAQRELKGLKAIPVGDRHAMVVDDEDYDRLIPYRWTLLNPKSRYLYAVHYRGSRDRLMAHRLVVDAAAGCHVDHKNGNTLDNRRENLRACNRSQNSCNSNLGRRNKSGVKGVHLHRGRWRVRVGLNGKQYEIGRFDSIKEAAMARNEAAKRIHGEFAKFAGPAGA